MKRVSRMFGICLSAVLLGSMATACSETKEGANSASTGSNGSAYDLEGKTITISALAGEPAAGLKTQVEGFKEKYGATMEVIEIPTSMFNDKLRVDLTSKSGAYDACLGVPDGWNQHMKASGYLEPLDQWYNDPNVADPNFDMKDFFESNLDYYSEDGVVYGMPWKPDVMLYYYRSDLFNDENEKAAFKEKYGYDLAVPTTYEQYLDIGDFFNRPDEGLYGSAMMGANADQLGNLFMNRLYSTDQASYFTEDWKAQMNTPDVIKVFENLQYEGQNFAMPGYETMTYEQNSAAFIEGKVAQTISWPALWNDSNKLDVSAYGASQVKGKVGVAVLPGWEDSDRGGYTMMGGWWACIPTDSKQKVEAYKMIEYICSKEGMIPKIDAGSYSVRKSTYEDEKVVGKDPEFYEIYGKQLDKQQAPPQLP